MTTLPTHIGFPPPLLGEEPRRLPILYLAQGLVALKKPVGVLPEAHPWYPKQLTIVQGIKAQLKKEKPELQRCGVECVYALHHMGPEESGVLILAVHKDSREYWRNAYGSRLLTFNYRIWVRPQKPIATDEIRCGLPIAVHNKKAEALVSHKTGKRCETFFKRLGKNENGVEQWQATTTYLRPHQIRLHAFEVGLPIAGDVLYGGAEPLKQRFKKKMRTGPWIDLESISYQAPAADSHAGFDIRV